MVRADGINTGLFFSYIVWTSDPVATELCLIMCHNKPESTVKTLLDCAEGNKSFWLCSRCLIMIVFKKYFANLLFFQIRLLSFCGPCYVILWKWNRLGWGGEGVVVLRKKLLFFLLFVDVFVVELKTKSVVSVNLSSDADDKLKIYRENFEKAYLAAAEEFYKQNAHEYLSDNGVQNYMKYADQKLKEEESRARRYLETGYGCQSVSAVSVTLFLLLAVWLSVSIHLSIHPCICLSDVGQKLVSIHLSIHHTCLSEVPLHLSCGWAMSSELHSTSSRHAQSLFFLIVFAFVCVLFLLA